jgi:hypothetical protein
METETSLPLATRRVHETGGGPGHVFGGNAVLHGANRTRSGNLCKGGPNTLCLLR